MLEVDCYLSSVGTGQAEFNDEDRLGGDDGVRGGVGRRSDHWVRAALSCNHTMQRRVNKVLDTKISSAQS